MLLAVASVTVVLMAVLHFSSVLQRRPTCRYLKSTPPRDIFKTKPGEGDGWTATGIGFAVATWGGGGRPVCEVEVRISSDGSVAVEVGTQDLGTGVRTYVAAIVAEELGLSVSDVTRGSAPLDMDLPMPLEEA